MRQGVARLAARLNPHAFEVLSGAVTAIILRAIGAGLAFTLNVVIGRLLGAQGAGLYFLALSVVTIGAVVAKVGLDNTLLRYIASGAARDDWNQVKGVFRIGMRLAMTTSLLVAVAVIAFAPWMAEFVFGEPALSGTLRAMGPGLFTFALMTLLSESLKGLKCIRSSMLVSGVMYPAFALIAVWPLTALMGAPGAALAYVLGTGAAAVIGWLMWRANTAPQPPRPTFDHATLWRSCRPLWTMSIINRGVLPWAPLFLLGIWGTAEDAGVFGAATRVAMLVTVFLAAVNTVIAPKFAELYTNGDIDAIGSLVRRFALIITLAASPLFLLLIVAGDRVMTMFGGDFSSGGTALAILAVGQAVNAMTGSVGNLLMMTGHERDMRNASILAVCLLVGCAVLLIPRYGIVGAAVASATAVTGMNLFSVASVWVLLGVSIIPVRCMK